MKGSRNCSRCRPSKEAPLINQRQESRSRDVFSIAGASLPASESQKKLLLDKMTKEGYSYDFNKHKLKKPKRHGRPKIDIAEKYADDAVKRTDKSLYESGYSRHTIMGITLFSGADIEEAVDYGREAERKRIMIKLRTWLKGHCDSSLVDVLTGFVDDLKKDK